MAFDLHRMHLIKPCDHEYCCFCPNSLLNRRHATG